MKKVFIATSRDVGKKCALWASENLIDGFVLVEDIKKADIVISVLHDRLFKNEILKKQCYNFHPGILPDYRGSGISSWVIINQEKFHGVTLHIIDEGMDTGDIIEINKFSIMENDTSFLLFKKIEDMIYNMFKQWFHKLLIKDFVAHSQKNTNKKIVYLKKDLKKALDLTKFIKAFYFPGKESPYYYNSESEKIYIEYDKQEK